MFNDRDLVHHIDDCSFWERSHSVFSHGSRMFSIDMLSFALLTGLSGLQSREAGFWSRALRALADPLRERHTPGCSWVRAEATAELEGVDGGLWGRHAPSWE